MKIKTGSIVKVINSDRRRSKQIGFVMGFDTGPGYKLGRKLDPGLGEFYQNACVFFPEDTTGDDGYQWIWVDDLKVIDGSISIGSFGKVAISKEA